ncbi:MAG: hypothetical protein KAT28_04485 [Candidatus Aenigmarchaeota archaeon]|nr:hypothetical protein [Candidatus Aenigmarchaeota archaeon]
MVEAGQICRKIAGREKGRYCIIVKPLDGSFAEISGAIKYGMCSRKRCNVKHLIITKYKIPLKGEKQEDIEKSISESGILKRLGFLKDKKRFKLLFNKAKKPKSLKKETPKTTKKPDVKSKIEEISKTTKKLETKPNTSSLQTKKENIKEKPKTEIK